MQAVRGPPRGSNPRAAWGAWHGRPGRRSGARRKRASNAQARTVFAARALGALWVGPAMQRQRAAIRPANAGPVTAACARKPLPLAAMGGLRGVEKPDAVKARSARRLACRGGAAVPAQNSPPPRGAPTNCVVAARRLARTPALSSGPSDERGSEGRGSRGLPQRTRLGLGSGLPRIVPHGTPAASSRLFAIGPAGQREARRAPRAGEKRAALLRNAELRERLAHGRWSGSGSSHLDTGSGEFCRGQPVAPTELGRRHAQLARHGAASVCRLKHGCRHGQHASDPGAPGKHDSDGLARSCELLNQVAWRPGPARGCYKRARRSAARLGEDSPIPQGVLLGGGAQHGVGWSRPQACLVGRRTTARWRQRLAIRQPEAEEPPVGRAVAAARRGVRPCGPISTSEHITLPASFPTDPVSLELTRGRCRELRLPGSRRTRSGGTRHGRGVPGRVPSFCPRGGPGDCGSGSRHIRSRLTETMRSRVSVSRPRAPRGSAMILPGRQISGGPPACARALGLLLRTGLAVTRAPALPRAGRSRRRPAAPRPRPCRSLVPALAMAVTRGPTTRRVAYTYDPETGNYSYGLQHPMKASPASPPRGLEQGQPGTGAPGPGEPPARLGRCR